MVKNKLPNNSKKFDYGIVWERDNIINLIKKKEKEISSLKFELIDIEKKLGIRK